MGCCHEKLTAVHHVEPVRPRGLGGWSIKIEIALMLHRVLAATIGRMVSARRREVGMQIRGPWNGMRCGMCKSSINLGAALWQWTTISECVDAPLRMTAFAANK